MSLDQLFGVAAIVPADAACTLGPWQPYRQLDHGRYDFAEAEVPATLVALAANAVGRPLRVERARVIRLRAGDYVLARHDPLRDDAPVEIVYDLSPRAAASEVVYLRRGRPFFQVPCARGTLAIVERGPTVSSYHTYVSKRDPAADVQRLVALLV